MVGKGVSRRIGRERDRPRSPLPSVQLADFHGTRKGERYSIDVGWRPGAVALPPGSCAAAVPFTVNLASFAPAAPFTRPANVPPPLIR